MYSANCRARADIWRYAPGFSDSAMPKRCAKSAGSPGDADPAGAYVLRHARRCYDMFRKHADVGRHHRATHRLRLRDHAAEQRRLDGGDRDEMRGRECRRHVVAMPRHADQVVDVHGLRSLEHVAPVFGMRRAFADDDKDKSADAVVDKRTRDLRNGDLAVPGRDPPGNHHDAVVGRHAPVRALRIRALRRNGGGIIGRGVDHPRHDGDLLGAQSVALHDRPGGIVRRRDDAVALRERAGVAPAHAGVGRDVGQCGDEPDRDL